MSACLKKLGDLAFAGFPIGNRQRQAREAVLVRLDLDVVDRQEDDADDLARD